MLNLVHLKILAAVARHGSVTEAARELHYSQPSVSHHLARLEAATGVKLVQRIGRGIRLTPEGRLLANRAAEIVGRVDAATNELAARLRSVRGGAARRVPARRLHPRIASLSDDMVVVQSLVAAGIGVATLPGLALQAHRRPDVHTTELTSFHRQIYAATYGDPPDPPAVAAVLAALTEATTPTTSTEIATVTSTSSTASPSTKSRRTTRRDSR
jgi:DNA-binding transcriptional LysR family regulator